MGVAKGAMGVQQQAAPDFIGFLTAPASTHFFWDRGRWWLWADWHILIWKGRDRPSSPIGYCYLPSLSDQPHRSGFDKWLTVKRVPDLRLWCAQRLVYVVASAHFPLQKLSLSGLPRTSKSCPYTHILASVGTPTMTQLYSSRPQDTLLRQYLSKQTTDQAFLSFAKSILCTYPCVSCLPSLMEV